MEKMENTYFGILVPGDPLVTELNFVDGFFTVDLGKPGNTPHPKL